MDLITWQLLQQKCTDMAYPNQYDTKLEVKHLQKLQNYVSYLWLSASNDFGASHYGIQTIKMGFNHFWMLVTFQYRGLHHLDMYCTLIIEAWLKSNIHFDCRYLEIWNACIISFVFIVFNVRDGTESKYPSIVFIYWNLSWCKWIHTHLLFSLIILSRKLMANAQIKRHGCVCRPEPIKLPSCSTENEFQLLIKLK